MLGVVLNGYQPLRSGSYSRKYHYYGQHKIRTCTKAYDVNFQRNLNRAGRYPSALRP